MLDVRESVPDSGGPRLGRFSRDPRDALAWAPPYRSSGEDALALAPYRSSGEQDRVAQFLVESRSQN